MLIRHMIEAFVAHYDINDDDAEVPYREKTDYITFKDFNEDIRSILKRCIMRCLICDTKKYFNDDFETKAEEFVGKYYADFNITDAYINGGFMIG